MKCHKTEIVMSLICKEARDGPERGGMALSGLGSASRPAIYLCYKERSI